MLTRGTERGARRPLADVDLEGEDTVRDIRELRGLLEAFNAFRGTVNGLGLVNIDTVETGDNNLYICNN